MSRSRELLKFEMKLFKLLFDSVKFLDPLEELFFHNIKFLSSSLCKVFMHLMVSFYLLDSALCLL